MTADLYQILGVPRDSDAAHIKRAFRKLAKSLHPDVGGDSVKFEAARQAHDVLSDPEMRAEYDRTGKVPVRGPDNAHAPVMQRLGVLLDLAIKKAEDAGRPWNGVDLVGAMRAVLDEHQRDRDAHRKRVSETQAKYRALLGRFRTRGENLLEAVVRSKVAQGDEMIKAVEASDAVDQEARRLLSSYAFDVVMQLAVPAGYGNGMRSSAFEFFQLKI